MNGDLLCWFNTLASSAMAFTVPSHQLFCQLAGGWVLCPGRRTLTRIYQMAEPTGARAHDAYHRFFRCGAWHMSELWRLLALPLVQRFYPTGRVVLDLDDTTFHKTGRRIQDAAWWRDAVRSTGQKVVHCFGLNLVVLTLRVNPPWGGEPLGLPILLRLHRKNGPTLLELAKEMVTELSGWFPERDFLLCADGFYAPLAGLDLPRTHLISRLRRDAAIYKPVPKNRRHKLGRPRKKGSRLPTPQELAVRNRCWEKVSVDFRGKIEKRLVATWDVLWYGTCGQQLIRLVICRDPQGKQHDDFFFTTDVSVQPVEIIANYSGRWCIEDTFKNVKQHLGGQDPQSWKHQGPERTAAFAFWLYSMIWLWFLTTQKTSILWIPLPWYLKKSTPSFADALAALRRRIWFHRLFPTSEIQSLSRKKIAPLIDTLAYAA